MVRGTIATHSINGGHATAATADLPTRATDVAAENTQAPIAWPTPALASGVPGNPLPQGVKNNFVHTLRLKSLLSNHPDQELVDSILDGFEFGYDIGFRGTLTNTFPKNNKSARENQKGVSDAVAKEISREHTAGPFSTPPFPVNHISPLGAAPKTDGSIRLIMDLSQPEGQSINEFISKEEFPTNYTPFDEATRIVRQLGRGCLLSKIDIKHAYRLLPVRPEDWPLLVYHWNGL